MNERYSTQLAWLFLVAALVLAAGLGLRDPWPADEPRFALIAKDMVESGNWLLPRAGGVLYPDKPPLFFWFIAAVYALTGSIRIAFLFPGLVAGLGALYLVTDLARRLWGPATAIWCGATLLALIQFPLQMKSAQIDGFLCFLTTLSLYGLCRHLLLGPDWRWFAAGGFAAGLGVITKGVGFLPLLVLIPYVLLARRADWQLPRFKLRDARWWLAPLAFLGAICLWLVPMLVATIGGTDPDLLAYRDNILFHQTITRYANSWGHLKPPWYLFTNAIPWLWLPASFILPWLVPAWRRDFRERNAPVVVLGSWALLVLLFFSMSMGKRSVYIFPAAPAFALIVGYHAESLVKRVGVQRVLLFIPVLIGLLLTAVGVYALLDPARVQPHLSDITAIVRTAAAVVGTGVVMLAATLIFRRRKVLTGYASAMVAFWLGLSLLVAPALDGIRSGGALIELVDARLTGSERLAFVAWPEQFLLQWNRPAEHFGYRRNPADDARDSAIWVSAADDRRVLLPDDLLEPCYDAQRAVRVGVAHRRTWMLVDAHAVRKSCIAGADEPELVVHYAPSGSRRSARGAVPSAAAAAN